ncbi:MAG TPA: hypothetical protein VL979_02525 [Solirubrobacteraceae bacterium]|nr:hypothetical protein [Solirubrobacteraceae bacterium]
MAEDAKDLIELATNRFLGEVSALAPMKLVVGVELRGRGDVQHFRLELPGAKVTRGPAADARVHVDMRREFFNVMAREAKIADWIEAFTYGQAKASGPDQILRLIVSVVERQLERERTPKARRHA